MVRQQGASVQGVWCGGRVKGEPHERGSFRMASSDGMAPPPGNASADGAASAGPGASARGSARSSPACKGPDLPTLALARAPSLRLKLNENEHLQPPRAARHQSLCPWTSPTRGSLYPQLPLPATFALLGRPQRPARSSACATLCCDR